MGLVDATPIHWTNDDGGRYAAGYKTSVGDCAARAIAIALEKPYQEVYDALNVFAQRERPRAGRVRSRSRDGVHRQTVRRYLRANGWIWTPTMQIGSGCKVHLRRDQLPSGRIIVALSKHFAAVIDGVIHDTHDCSRDGTRCVYGYWSAPSSRDVEVIP